MMLQTPRLIVRKPRKSDWKDIVEGCKELDISKNTAVIPHPYRKKDAEWFINDSLKKWRKKEKTAYNFFIELKSEKKVIGVISLMDINYFHGVAETGSWINKKYWRKGYISEAKIAVNEFAFNKLKLRRLYSPVFKENIASTKTQEKMGYKLEGVERKSAKCKATNKIHDNLLFGLLKEDWKKKLPKLKRDLEKKLK